ncbi:MAG: Fic family protein [Nanoarchaeota archaeon]
MVRINKKTINGNSYFYLEHAMRKNGQVKKKELYLGKNIPHNIEELKRKFLSEIRKEKWHPLLNSIKKGYAEELKRMPVSARQKEQETFAVRFTYDTQRIEGSTLTLRETADLLEKGISPHAKPIGDIKEAEAHKDLFQEVLECKKDLSLSLVLHWHRRLFLGTKPDIAGQIRTHQVAISGSRFMPPFPAEIYPLLMDFFTWYSKKKGTLHPVELAALVHLKFVTIHPFTDGNGRMSRLMMNFILNRHDYPLFNIPYEGRKSYYTALERAQVKKTDSIFLNWFIKQYMHQQKRFLKG